MGSRNDHLADGIPARSISAAQRARQPAKERVRPVEVLVFGVRAVDAAREAVVAEAPAHCDLRCGDDDRTSDPEEDLPISTSEKLEAVGHRSRGGAISVACHDDYPPVGRRTE